MRPKIEPCPSCPWRVSTQTHEIPGGGLDQGKAAEVACGGPLRMGLVMSCHLSRDSAPRPCAGFILRVGFESPALRLAALRGVVEPDDYADGGLDLHESWHAMLVAHGLRPQPLR